MPSARPVPVCNHVGQRGEQQSEFYHQSHLRRAIVVYEFDHVGDWIKETVQRWSDKNGSASSTETLVSREPMIT